MRNSYTFLLAGAILVLLCTAYDLTAQRGEFESEVDSIEISEYIEPIDGPKPKIFSGRPGRAALFSLVLPGAGQIYNKKYWQAPIVWGAVGGMGALAIHNTEGYQLYRDAYRARLIAERDGEPPPVFEDEVLNRLSNDALRRNRDNFNRSRQMSIIGTGLVWLLNSVHAFVSTHLEDFDVSDDISIQFTPVIPDYSAPVARVGIFVVF